jgi:hypothetical protein
MRRATLLVVLALSVGCYGMPGFGCCVDGLFRFRGVVVDRGGKGVPKVMVKARNTSVVSDEDGCFAIGETTYPGQSEMPFSVAATGFRPFIGTITNVDSSLRLMRISLTDAKSTSEAVIDAAVKKGTLGICETKPVEWR